MRALVGQNKQTRIECIMFAPNRSTLQPHYFVGEREGNKVMDGASEKDGVIDGTFVSEGSLERDGTMDGKVVAEG
jgi:hypothetical protein